MEKDADSESHSGLIGTPTELVGKRGGSGRKQGRLSGTPVEPDVKHSRLVGTPTSSIESRGGLSRKRGRLTGTPTDKNNAW
ncbi:MAG: hypothetical protein JXB30_01670 [Anaerolineae bacterium]|nr:hypothetical protein [Anaerolineae bacterium]